MDAKKTLCIFVVSIFTLAACAAEDFQWREKAKMPASARNGAAVCAGEKIFFMGGSGSRVKNYEYDPASDAWVKRANLITDGWNIALAYFNGKIYVFGGDPFMDRSEAYDISTDSWKRLKPMPTRRQHLKCGVSGGKIFVLGGLEKGFLTESDSSNDWDAKARVSGKNEMYDPQTDTWKRMAPLPIPMHSPNAYVAVIGKLIYVMGGMGDNKSIWTDLKTVEAYSTVTDKWEIKKDLPFPVFIGAAVVDNKLYALGIDASGKGKLARYRSETDSWEIVGDIPVVRWQAGMASFNRSIFIFGGNDSNFTPFADVYEILFR